jgi:hypothetical protein
MPNGAKWNLPIAINAAKKGGYRGLKAVGDVIGDEAQSLAPKDTEELANSMTVSGDYGSLKVAISFDTGNRYAIVQHENTSLNHPNGGQAKYLQEPLLGTGANILAGIIGSEIAKEM